MKAQKEKFTKGCVAGGMKKEVVQKLWEQIETFAAYGFNKAHAASYGNLAYKTAYMKANFPVDYMAAILTADAGDVERIAEVVAECKRMGIKVWPPSVNESRGRFTVVDDPSNPSGQAKHIRFGLYSIKNFGEGVADTIIAARLRQGSDGQAREEKFTDIADFFSRITDKNLNKKQLESLIQCGAFDDMGITRGELIANLEILLDYHRQHLNAPKDQGSLFGALSSPKITLSMKEAQPVPMDVLLQWEKDLLGLYVSGHPLDKYKSKFNDEKKSIKHAKEHLKGVEIVIAGFIENARINMTKSGERMGFLRLADFSDGIDIVAFPRTYKEYESIMAPGACIAVKGRISERNGEQSFVVERAKAL
jgi:DNA polymerase-3 subunit alpha